MGGAASSKSVMKDSHQRQAISQQSMENQFEKRNSDDGIENLEKQDDEFSINTFQVKQKQKSVLKNKNVSHLSTYEQLEAKLPFQLLQIRQFEGKLKKLVYDRETITIRQLQYVLSRDFEDFDDLSDPNSVLYKIVNCKEFKLKGQENQEGQMSIQYLMLLGILYCQGSNEDKSRVLFDVLQDGLQEFIGASDKDLKDCFGKLISLPTLSIHEWALQYAQISNGGQIEACFEKNEENQEKWKEVLAQIEEKFLDEVFDVKSKLPREEFIKVVAAKQSFLFSAKKIRELAVETFNNL